MKKILKIVTVLVLVLCVIISICCSDNCKDFFSLFTTMLSGLCGLATLYIAVLLYDQYGVESKAKEINLKAIQLLVSEMQKVHFILHSKLETDNDGTTSDCVICIDFQSDKDKITDALTPESLSELLYYSDSGMYGCSIIVNKLQSNVFIPSPIADALKQLLVFKYEPQIIEKQTRPFTILKAYSEQIDCSNDSNINLPNRKLSVAQFLDKYFEVKDAIKKWYQNNEIELKDLNLTY